MVGLAGWYLIAISKQRLKSTLAIGNSTFNVDLAERPEDLIKGLSWRRSLSSNNGLLMIYGTDGQHGIWMKDMHFAIDVIWINKDYKVVYIVSDMHPDSYPRVYRPDQTARYVLEIESGRAAAAGIKIGDIATFNRR